MLYMYNNLQFAVQKPLKGNIEAMFFVQNIYGKAVCAHQRRYTLKDQLGSSKELSRFIFRDLSCTPSFGSPMGCSIPRFIGMENNKIVQYETQENAS